MPGVQRRGVSVIDIREYVRFKSFEDYQSGLKNFYFRARVINIDGCLITVKDVHHEHTTLLRINKYDFFVHLAFGVVKALNDGGTLIDKSPLCEKLDKEIFG